MLFWVCDVGRQLLGLSPKGDTGEMLQSGVSSGNFLTLRLDQAQILPCSRLALRHFPSLSGWDSLPLPVLTFLPHTYLHGAGPGDIPWGPSCHFASCCSPWPLYPLSTWKGRAGQCHWCWQGPMDS